MEAVQQADISVINLCGSREVVSEDFLESLRQQAGVEKAMRKTVKSTNGQFLWKT